MDAGERDRLLATLEERFAKHMNRHPEVEWDAVLQKLEVNPEKLRSLYEMEQTGGEPDVIGRDEQTGEYLFVDCAPESPTRRRSLCYDRAALEARKKHKPEGNVVDMAAQMGVELLTEEQYRHLQTVGEFDRKTSSWIKTPADIRQRGGAVFCDRRYGHVWLYHNGADSYYAARGFRGLLKV